MSGARQPQGPAEIASHWTAMTSIAMLGTNRGAPSPEKVWPPGAEVAVPPGPVERTLLRAAAMSYLWQLAGGRVPTGQVPSSELAPATNAPVVREAAAWRLARMLTGDHRDLVGEWLMLAAGAGAVLPPHWLPAVLNELKPQERAVAGPVLGPRAEWLARRNPEWADRSTIAGLPIERWNNGTLPERRIALAMMRAADPTGARVWLEGAWQTESPDARVAFLETLLSAPGLSDADESFLETALNDKRKDVRAAAVECLCRLPSSGHARRNIERLDGLVNMTESGTGLLSRFKKRRLEITLPDALDKVAACDGVNTKPPAHQNIGERAYWLMQMIAMVRPAYWCERFNCDIETFIGAALDTDYAADLVGALASAAIRHRDAAWLAALSTRLLEWHGTPERSLRASQTLPELVAASPPSGRDELLRRLLAASQPQQLDFLQGALLATDTPWGPETTRIAFELLGQCTELVAPEYAQGRQALARWGPRVDVATASQALARILERVADKSPWKSALDTLQGIIEFRLAMRQELAK